MAANDGCDDDGGHGRLDLERICGYLFVSFVCLSFFFCGGAVRGASGRRRGKAMMLLTERQGFIRVVEKRPENKYVESEAVQGKYDLK